MNNQTIIENLLDMWLSTVQLEAIKDNWKAFYDNPMGYKDTAIIGAVKQFITEKISIKGGITLKDGKLVVVPISYEVK